MNAAAARMAIGRAGIKAEDIKAEDIGLLISGGVALRKTYLLQRPLPLRQNWELKFPALTGHITKYVLTYNKDWR